MTLKLCIFLFLVTFVLKIEASSDRDLEKLKNVGRKLVEEGRTMVHHAVKRFMIILPAIFFKLGIAFTLLILVSLAVINNGFIGFLILVVGLSSVLARLQGSSKPAAVSYISPLPHYHHQVWDRSDSATMSSDLRNDHAHTKAVYYDGLNGYNSPQLTSYYAKYGASKM